ncbi:MAG: GntR family transcriptional regulator [Clostridiales bacterium]|nr:GntR family transcriptional regulator [Clostridiales bacterium]
MMDGDSLRIRVFNTLENQIINGELVPGDALNEIKLSKELGVSRTPIREALRQLELEGLVENVPNKGCVVIGISEKDIEDIYAIRVRMEGLAARWSALHISDEDKNRLNEILDLQEFYLQKEDYDRIWKLDTEFHSIIYKAADSRPLQNMLTSFHNYVRRARGFSMKAEGRSVKTVAEHRKIVDAICAGDADAAEAAMTSHILKALENLKENLKKSGKSFV